MPRRGEPCLASHETDRCARGAEAWLSSPASGSSRASERRSLERACGALRLRRALTRKASACSTPAAAPVTVRRNWRSPRLGDRLDSIPEPSPIAARITAPNLAFRWLRPARRCRFPPSSFDLVVAFEVIEHLRDYRAFLDEVRRVLSPAASSSSPSPNKLYYAESRGDLRPESLSSSTSSNSTNFAANSNASSRTSRFLLQNHVESRSCFTRR